MLYSFKTHLTDHESCRKTREKVVSGVGGGPNGPVREPHKLKEILIVKHWSSLGERRESTGLGGATVAFLLAAQP